MKIFPKKIAIIGVGLIGGSIALGLKKHFGSKINIFGLCRSAKRGKKAVESGIIDKAISDVKSIPSDIDLIIIATPISEILEILNRIARIPLKSYLVFDVGSTKKIITDAAAKILPKNALFIGTHPMAGSEMSGFENADPNLFRNKPWIVCSALPTTNRQLSTIKNLIDALGAKFILMNAKMHDGLTVWASHIFLAVSSILIGLITKKEAVKEIAKIASTGFRDTTRLASDNPKMKTDIFLTNKDNVINSLDCLIEEINYFKELLIRENEREVLHYLMNSKLQRDNWLAQYFS